MKTLNRLLTIALGLFLISAGVAKFTTGHVFQYIEFKSGIDLFYPFVNNLTGIAEILAGAAILYRPTRLTGAVAALHAVVPCPGINRTGKISAYRNGITTITACEHIDTREAHFSSVVIT